MTIRLRSAAALATAAAALALAVPAAAQQLTLERIFNSGDFSASGFYPDWSDDGEAFVVVEVDPQTQAGDVWTVGIADGKRSRRIQGSKLVAEGRSEPIDVEEVAWSADGRRALVYTNSQQVWRARTKGTYYVYDLQAERLVPLSRGEGWQQFAKFSPDGTRVGFVRDNDLFVVDLATGRETRLTTTGSDTVINGTFDWVYEEELGLQDGWRWSPDGKRIAFWQLNQGPVPVFTWVNDLAGQYSVPVGLRYPKPGEPNSRVRIGVVDLASGDTRWMDTGEGEYLARMEWAASPDELVIQRMNRLQNRIDVLLADANTGRSRALFSDADSAWVDVDDDLTFVRGGREIVWSSEREGYNQLYLYGRDGRLIRKLTREPWDVTSVDGVDERGGWVYFTGTGGNAAERHLYRVKLDGSGLRKLTREPGTHRASVSPDGRWFVDVYSRAGVAPVSRLHRADGTLVRGLEDNARVQANLTAAGVGRPEFFRVPTGDGAEMNAVMIRPAGFEPAKKYPVLFYVYGTPGAQTVTDAWGGSRYLWHQLLAQKGYVVVSVDTRGTSNRGRAWEKAGYGRHGVQVTDDLMTAARYMASQPYVDPARIGMWGWSGGGYTTGLSLARGGKLYRAGISVAPVTDWRLYDNIYTERFMGLPAQNRAGYDATSVIGQAPGFEADYLLVHGTADDNVHFQNSVQLAAALQEAGKQFSFMLYPNKNHAIPGRQTQLHLFTMMTDWLEEHL
ncbi:MAG TPA: DPP IV N-terminal domain-containing protein [Longimicrobiaceae bacterium]|nr:DPP IV N-terminal domain-containing protein [Longimicrobiaceae bacterium]